MNIVLRFFISLIFLSLIVSRTIVFIVCRFSPGSRFLGIRLSAYESCCAMPADLLNRDNKNAFRLGV